MTYVRRLLKDCVWVFVIMPMFLNCFSFSCRCNKISCPMVLGGKGVCVLILSILVSKACKLLVLETSCNNGVQLLGCIVIHPSLVSRYHVFYRTF